MLQLHNDTPFAAHCTVLPDPTGIDTLYVTVKATFDLLDPARLAQHQQPVQMQDVYWGEPHASSLRYCSDIGLGKPATDVALVGSAWAPNQRAVTSLDVTLEVGGRTQTLRVSGDRIWRRSLLGVRPSAPEPFTRLPLIYERAFGGTCVAGETPDADGRNPVGVGYCGKQAAVREMVGLPVPNIENPRTLLRRAGSRRCPAVAGFGFIAASWTPRSQFSGTYDASWQNQRAPLLPLDFDSRYFQAAHPAWQFRPHLRGGETIGLLHCAERSRIRFRLPTCVPQVEVVGPTRGSLPLLLETVLLETDGGWYSLLWRGAWRCGMRALEVASVTIRAR